MRDLPSPSISGLVQVLSSLRFWSPWIQPGPDSCSSGVLFSGTLPGACSSPSGILVFPRSCSLGSSLLRIQSGSVFCPIYDSAHPWSSLFKGPACSRVQPGTGSCFSRVLPGPSSCPPRVQVVQRSRMAQGTALPGSRPPKSWPSGRLLGSRLPGLPRALGSQPSADHGPRPRPEERARGPGRAGRAH